MDSFKVTESQVGKATVFQLAGYFNADAGKQLRQQADKAMQESRVLLVFDFADCPAVNSPGAAALLDLTLTVVDDCHGRVLLSGLNPLKLNFFTMAGIIPVAETVATREDACKVLNEPG